MRELFGLFGIFGGIDPIKQMEMMDRIRKEQMARRLPLCVPWDPQMKWAKELNIKAETYKPYSLFEVGPSGDVDPDAIAKYAPDRVLSPDGKFMYCEKLLPKGRTMPTLFGNRKGTVMFDADVVIPCLHEWQEWRQGWKEHPWMSLTPSEMMSLRPGTKKARGHTVVAGLGLGYQLIEVSKKKSVKRITLVEQSQELVTWLMPHIRPLMAGAVFEIIVGDAREIVPTLTADVALIDIAPNYGNNTFKRCPNISTVWVWGAAAVSRDD